MEDADSGEADSGEADSARVDSEDISDLEGVMEAPTGFRQEGCEVEAFAGDPTVVKATEERAVVDAVVATPEMEVD